MTRRDEADPLAFEVMENGEGGVATVAEFREVCGKGHLAITAHSVASHLPLTAAPSAMPLSLLPAAIDVRLGQGHPLGYPTGTLMPTGCSASAPSLSPIVGRLSDMLY